MTDTMEKVLLEANKEITRLRKENEALRNAGMTMQVVVGKILGLGGTEITSWFEKLAEAQRTLASATHGTRIEFEELRKSLEIDYD